MSKIKKILLVSFALLVFGSGALAAAPVFGQSTLGDMEKHLQTAAETGAGFGKPIDPRLQVSIIIRNVLAVIGVLFIALMVYAGFLWMTAGGNEDNIDKAKGLIKAAIIGLFIIVSAYAITWAVASLVLGGEFGSAVKTGETQDLEGLLK